MLGKKSAALERIPIENEFDLNKWLIVLFLLNFWFLVFFGRGGRSSLCSAPNDNNNKILIWINCDSMRPNCEAVSMPPSFGHFSTLHFTTNYSRVPWYGFEKNAMAT